MKKSKFTESQTVKFLKENEGGRSVLDICRELGVVEGIFYRWRENYAGMDTAQLSRLRELEKENRRLKQILADMSLDNKMLKNVLSKKW
ncbi:MAG: transposase [Bacteroidota bacterium]